LENINILYPSWFIVLIVTGALCFGFILYYKEKKFNEQHPYLKYVLFTLRSLAAGLIAFFLLEPFFKNINEEVKNPILVIAMDESSSMTVNQDKEDIKQLQADLEIELQSLSDKFEIQRFSFGEQVSEGLRDSFTHKASNISALFSHINKQFYGRPLAGTILIS